MDNREGIISIAPDLGMLHIIETGERVKVVEKVDINSTVRFFYSCPLGLVLCKKHYLHGHFLQN